MSTSIRFSSGLHVFDNTMDRFVDSGYKEKRTLEQVFTDTAKVKDPEALNLMCKMLSK
jgi:hypothetical protein